MDKPLVLMLEEFKEGLVNLINDSKLPPSQFEPIIRDIYEQTVTARKQEVEQAKAQYESELAKEQTEPEVKE